MWSGHRESRCSARRDVEEATYEYNVHCYLNRKAAIVSLVHRLPRAGYAVRRYLTSPLRQPPHPAPRRPATPAACSSCTARRTDCRLLDSKPTSSQHHARVQRLGQERVAPREEGGLPQGPGGECALAMLVRAASVLNLGCSRVQSGLMGRNKDSSDSERSQHVARPLTDLKDPSSFAPPPKRSGGVPPPPPPSGPRKVVAAPSKYQDPRAPAVEPAPIEAPPDYDDEPAPRGPYRVNTTGLTTDHLPRPPGRKDGADGRTSPSKDSFSGGATRAGPPSLPPRLPPRSGSASPQKSVSPSGTGSGLLNQGAVDRLGAAGVSVPGFGIGRSSPANASSPSPHLPPTRTSSRVRWKWPQPPGQRAPEPLLQDGAIVGHYSRTTAQRGHKLGAEAGGAQDGFVFSQGPFLRLAIRRKGGCHHGQQLPAASRRAGRGWCQERKQLEPEIRRHGQGRKLRGQTGSR